MAPEMRCVVEIFHMTSHPLESDVRKDTSRVPKDTWRPIDSGPNKFLKEFTPRLRFTTLTTLIPTKK